MLTPGQSVTPVDVRDWPREENTMHISHACLLTGNESLENSDAGWNTKTERANIYMVLKICHALL